MGYENVVLANKKRAKHGMATSKIYKVWSSMHDRCRNPNNARYARYGGRGIGVCKRWNSFAYFYADMGNPPHKHSLERKNNNGNYSKRNCYWATSLEQAQNRKSCVYISFGGETKTVAAWARTVGVTKTCLLHRMRLGQKPPELLSPDSNRGRVPALYKFGDEMLPLLEISKRTGVKLQTLYYRVWNNKPLF